MSASGIGDHEPTTPSGVVAVVLAAGRGARFTGGTKQLADLDGTPLVGRVVATALEAGVDRVVVVVGHDAGAVASAARRAGPVEVVVNPEHQLGLATSLRAGVRAAALDVAATTVVVLLADQPGVTAESVRAVAVAVGEGPVAARASYLDGPGHPVAFAREVWPRLLASAGDVGARDLLEALDVAHVLVAGRVPDDVDTEHDLEALRRRGVRR